MRTLLTIDAKNYTDAMPVLERFAVRAIIRSGSRFAMQCSSEGEYKLPGGGVENGESLTQALLREVREETGMLVDPCSIRELGEILEVRRDRLDPKQKYIAHSYYYSCDVLPDTVCTELTASELALGFRLEWAELPDIIERSAHFKGIKPWVERDMRFLSLILEGEIEL